MLVVWWVDWLIVWWVDVLVVWWVGGLGSMMGRWAGSLVG